MAGIGLFSRVLAILECHRSVAATSNSGITFRATKLRGCKVSRHVNTFLRDLWSSESPQWQNGTYLKDIIPVLAQARGILLKPRRYTITY